MKAIIFATSIKRAQNSNTKAWCNELNKTFKENNIKSEIINLRDYDYEASTGDDLLHKEMYKLYDADLIFFTSPTNFGNMTFYLHNLLQRFIHAQSKAEDKGLSIFANKRFEYCPTFGCCTNESAASVTDWEEYEEKTYPGGVRSALYPYLGMRHNKAVYEKLNFIRPLGLINLHINSWNPIEPIGPDRRTMHGHPQTLATIDRIMKKIKAIGLESQESKPSHTVEEFVECFKADAENAFGRGLTLAVENMDISSVKKHIKYLNNNKDLPDHVRYQAIVAMKDRAVKAGLYDVAEMYYDQQARHNTDWYEDHSTWSLNKNGNMRPNDY